MPATTVVVLELASEVAVLGWRGVVLAVSRRGRRAAWWWCGSTVPARWGAA